MDISLWIEQQIGTRLLSLHDAIYKGTNGRIGHRIPFGPVNLILHTVGAKTGKARANTLTYARDGDAYLVVASKGGDPKAPGWYHNLKANPTTTLEIGKEKFQAKATITTDPERQRLFDAQAKVMPNFNEYQKNTTRQIPVIVLERI